MRSYSLSWNLGGVFSFILGTIVLFFINDNLLMFDFALLFSIVGAVSAFLIQKPESKAETELIIPTDNGLKCIPFEENASFPLYIPLVIIAIYGFLIAGLGLTYPLKSDLLNYAIFTNYLFYAIRLASQTVAISKSMDFQLNRVRKLVPYSMVVIAIGFFVMGINQNLIVFGVLFFVFGTFSALLYTFSFKLVVFKNISENTSKYSAYFETMVGIGFFFGPVALGFLASFGINVGFIFLAAISALCLLFYVLKRNKIKIES